MNPIKETHQTGRPKQVHMGGVKRQKMYHKRHNQAGFKSNGTNTNLRKNVPIHIHNTTLFIIIYSDVNEK